MHEGDGYCFILPSCLDQTPAKQAKFILGTALFHSLFHLMFHISYSLVKKKKLGLGENTTISMY